MEKRANVNRDSFNVNPWKAREMDLIHFRQSGAYLGTLDFGIPTAEIDSQSPNRRLTDKRSTACSHDDLSRM